MFWQRNFLTILISLLILAQSNLTIANDQEKKELVIESIKAKKISNDIKGNLLLEGNVFIKTNLLDFQTDKAFFNESNGLLELNGNVEVSRLGLNITSNEIMANLKKQSFSIKNTEINRNNTNFVKAELFHIKTSGDVELINSSVNNCTKDDPAWEISIKRIDYIEDKKNAVIRGIKLKIRNIPVFYLPYLRTSVGNERMSGFLTPGLRQTSNGLDLSLPYYFNLSPNYDLVIAPRHITKRGSGMTSIFRYLSKKSNGVIKLSGISNDKKYEDETEKTGNRWNIVWQQESNFNQHLHTSLNFQSASDEYFFRDIGNDQFGQSRTSYLPRKLGLTWNNSFIKVGLDFKRYQILNPFSSEEFRSMPSFTIQSNLSKKGLSFSLLSNITKFQTQDANTSEGSYKNIRRAYLIPEIHFKKYFPSSKLSFSLGTKETSYKLKSQNFEKSSPWMEMKYSLFFDKYKKKSLNTFLPTIKYSYVKEGKSDYELLIDSRISSLDYRNLFQRDRYVGFDRANKSNKVILGFQHMHKGTNHKTFRSFSLGQAFYLDKQTDYFNPLEKRNKSPLVAEFKTSLTDKISSNGLIEWDKHSSRVNSASFSFSYQNSKRNRFELRSIYRRKDLNNVSIPWVDLKKATRQTELLTLWPISKSFLLFGRLHKDHEFNKSNDILFGFEYSNCCMKWGLMHRKWIDEDYFSWRNNYSSAFQALSNGFNPSKQRDNTYLFFELKDIGRFGKEISKMLSSTKLE